MELLKSDPVDLTELLDSGGWTSLRLRVLSLGALTVVLDGLDNQMLGLIVPALIQEWGVSRATFVPVIAASLIAMSIGSALAGKLGDRVGRKPALIGSILMFAMATLASATATDLVSLASWRCLAAIGLGGAMPNATALLAEYAPARHRSMAVTLGIVCVPLGGLVGGLIAAQVLPGLGWRALLIIGGTAPLLSLAIIVPLLPESPRFLVGRPERRDQLLTILRHYDPLLDPTREFVSDTGDEARAQRSILASGLRADTMALWAAFFFCLLAVYSMFNWAPTLLAEAGLGLGSAASGLASFNFGGILGAIGGALLMDRFGSRRPMVGIGLLGAALCVVGGVVVGTGVESAIIIVLGLQGACISGLQVMLFALAAAVYPADARATGVGAALAVGRAGAVVSSILGSVALTMGPQWFLAVIALAMVVTSMVLLAVRRHVVPRVVPGGKVADPTAILAGMAHEAARR